MCKVGFNTYLDGKCLCWTSRTWFGLGLGLGLGEWFHNLTAMTRSDVLRLSLLYTNKAFRDMFCCVRWFNTTGCFYNPLLPLTKHNK